MPGLTAKVFRTYNASATLQNELPGEEALAGLSVAEKVLEVVRAFDAWGGFSRFSCYNLPTSLSLS